MLKQAPAGFSAATKCFCTEHEQRVAEFVARALGAEATLWNDITKGLVYAPGYTIMGGTSNVMRNILGERVLGLPGNRGEHGRSPNYSVRRPENDRLTEEFRNPATGRTPTGSTSCPGRRARRSSAVTAAGC